MNWIKEIIDNFYFRRSLKMNDVGLSAKDKEWLQSHAKHQMRIIETMKAYILNQTFNSLTVRDHQRRKDYYDCLTMMQKLCKDTEGKEQIDFLTMKPRKKEEKKKN